MYNLKHTSLLQRIFLKSRPFPWSSNIYISSTHFRLYIFYKVLLFPRPFLSPPQTILFCKTMRWVVKLYCQVLFYLFPPKQTNKPNTLKFVVVLQICPCKTLRCWWWLFPKGLTLRHNRSKCRYHPPAPQTSSPKFFRLFFCDLNCNFSSLPKKSLFFPNSKFFVVSIMEILLAPPTSIRMLNSHTHSGHAKKMKLQITN